jgi:hypothetical protein
LNNLLVFNAKGPGISKARNTAGNKEELCLWTDLSMASQQLNQKAVQLAKNYEIYVG